MATRSEARPIRRELVRWPAWTRSIGIGRARVDAVPETLAQSMLGPVILLARLTMGWIFAYAGFEKLIEGFTSAGFLQHAAKGPLTFWFHSLGASSTAVNIIDPLVVWGEIFIGLALVFGVFTRVGLFFAAVQLMLYYLAQFPPANNPFMGYHLVYIVILGLLGVLGAGRIVGLDAWIERVPWVRRNRAVTAILG